MEFHEKLQELRKSRGLTQEELAEALFVSRTAISKWESGRGYPSIDSLKEISRYFSDCRQSPGKSRAFLHLWPFFWYNRNIRRAVFFYDDKKFR